MLLIDEAGAAPRSPTALGAGRARAPPLAQLTGQEGLSTGVRRGSAAGLFVWHAEWRDIASFPCCAASGRLAPASSACCEGG